MQNPPTAGTTTDDYNITGSIAAGCTFEYCKNRPTGCGTPDMTITYSATNGNVSVDAEI